MLVHVQIVLMNCRLVSVVFCCVVSDTHCRTPLLCAHMYLFMSGHSYGCTYVLSPCAVNIDRAAEAIIAASKSFSVQKPAEVQPDRKKAQRSRSFGANIGGQHVGGRQVGLMYVCVCMYVCVYYDTSICVCMGGGKVDE